MPAYDLWESPVSGRWYVTWTVGGRSRRATTGTKDREQAERVRAAFVLEHDRPKNANLDEIAVATVLQNYLDRHALKLPSAEAAQIAANHLTAFYGLATVDAINAHSHDRYRSQCLREGSAVGTINKRRGVLRAALRKAVEWGELATAPFVPSDREPDPRPHALSHKQVAVMLREADRLGFPHIALFIRLAVATGARRGAILDLTWDRVDLKAGTVDFRLPGVNHTRKRRAFTALPTTLINILRKERRAGNGGRVIQYNGRSVKGIRRAFRLVAKAAKVPHVTPHVLKHTAVTWALRVASPWIVSGMTATSMRTLQAVYGKHLTADLREAAEAVASSADPRKSRAKKTGKSVSGKAKRASKMQASR